MHPIRVGGPAAALGSLAAARIPLRVAAPPGVTLGAPAFTPGVTLGATPVTPHLAIGAAPVTSRRTVRTTAVTTGATVGSGPVTFRHTVGTASGSFGVGSPALASGLGAPEVTPRGTARIATVTLRIDTAGTPLGPGVTFGAPLTACTLTGPGRVAVDGRLATSLAVHAIPLGRFGSARRRASTGSLVEHSFRALGAAHARGRGGRGLLERPRGGAQRVTRGGLAPHREIPAGRGAAVRPLGRGTEDRTGRTMLADTGFECGQRRKPAFRPGADLIRAAPPPTIVTGWFRFGGLPP